MPAKAAVYWDSCVFLDWMKQDKADRVALIKPLVDSAMAGELLIVTSTWTLVEIIRTEGGAVRTPEEEKKIVDFLKNDYIEVRAVTRAVAEMARTLLRASANLPLSLPKDDAIHIATVLSSPVRELHTFDANHLFPHDNRWGEPFLRIGKPCPAGHMTNPPPPPEPILFSGVPS